MNEIPKSDLDLLTEELMEEPEFKEAYERQLPQMDILVAMVKARKDANMTQEELSERSGISQADISKLENGTRNPSLNLLTRLAAAMDTTLRIEFVPNRKINA